MERSEDQKVFRDPIEVTLGGEMHQIAPLVIKEARVWRKSFATLIGKLPGYAKTTTDDADSFGDAVTGLLVSTPDEMADLFFQYAKNLNREEIEDVATEGELAAAFEKVMAVAFPLVNSLTGAMGKMAQ